MNITANYSSTVEVTRFSFLARTLILMGMACFLLSTPLMNKFFGVSVLLILCSNGWKGHWRIFFQQKKIVLFGLLILLLLTVGMIYSEAGWYMGYRTWNRYLKILYLLFIPLFIPKKMRRQACYFLIAGVMVNEVFAYLDYFNLLTLGYPSTKHWLFVQDIDASYIIAFTTFLLANLIFDQKKYRAMWVIFFLVCSIDILFLNQERTGYLIYLALAGLFLWQRFSWQGLIGALMLIPLVLGALFLSSPHFKVRTQQAFSEVWGYHQGQKETSIGLRLAFAEYSFKVIRQHFVFGAGTGSFKALYQKLNGPKMNGLYWPVHPHNEYVDILLQLGIVGLAVFLYWLYLPLKMSFQLPSEERKYLQGLVLGFILLGFCNASLLVNPAGAFYVSFLAVFLAANHEH